MTAAAAPSDVTELAALQALGAELIERDRWSRAQVLSFQRKRLRELLAHAVAESPYYREALGADAGTGGVPLDELPTLPKATLVEQFDRIVTDPQLCLRDVEEYLADPAPAGRSDDILRFPGVAGREVAVHPYRLRAPFAALREVRQYQILHDERGLRVHVVLHPSAPEDTPARVRAAVLAAVEAAGAVRPPVDVVPVETIEREAGHAAKLKLVKALAPLR